MVRSFIEKNEKIFKWVLIGLLCALILFDFVLVIAGVIMLDFWGGTAQFINFILFASLFGLLLFALFAKKTNLARLVGTILLSYWVVSKLLSVGSPFADMAIGTDPFLTIMGSMFELFANFAAVGVVVFYILGAMFGKEFKIVIDILLLAFLGLNVLAFTFNFIDVCVQGFFIPQLMNCLITDLVFPALAVIGFIYLAPAKLEK